MQKTTKISIVVPTYQEAGNIPALAGRLYAAAAGQFDLEMIIVDVFTYDALGRRIEKIEYSPGGNTTTRYYYDGWKVLTETDAGQSRQRDYVYGNYLDEVVMIVDPCQAGDVDRYLTQDHLYSPVAILDDSGTILERYEYDAYGTRHVFDDDFTDERTTSDYDLTIAFTGQRLDTLGSNGLELMYYKNRYYLPQFGRFITRDPLGVRDSIGLFEFSNIDKPKGLNWWLVGSSHLNLQKKFSQEKAIQSIEFINLSKFILRQYNEGSNLYEYCNSNVIVCVDLYGLNTCRMTSRKNSDNDYWFTGYQDLLHMSNPNNPSSEERRRDFFENQPPCPPGLTRFRYIKYSNNTSEFVPEEMKGTWDITVKTWCAKCIGCCPEARRRGNHGSCRKITISKAYTVDLRPDVEGMQRGETIFEHKDVCACIEWIPD